MICPFVNMAPMTHFGGRRPFGMESAWKQNIPGQTIKEGSWDLGAGVCSANRNYTSSRFEEATRLYQCPESLMVRFWFRKSV